jgi:hypothetical protein
MLYAEPGERDGKQKNERGICEKVTEERRGELRLSKKERIIAIDALILSAKNSEQRRCWPGHHVTLSVKTGLESRVTYR